MAETFVGAGTPWSWPVPLAPTPRDVIATYGGAKLLRFRGEGQTRATPLFIVPSMINRWYVVDLREGASLVSSLVRGGLDVFCLDWGVAADEDRHLTWDDVVKRLEQAMSKALRVAGAPRTALLGYCMGGTLASIAAALQPARTSALVNLAGPIDFSRGGLLSELVQPGHFDVDAIAAAGNVAPMQMQSGFWALRPTQQIAKWIGIADRGNDPAFREAFGALETWASDNVPFPAAAYVTYIRELYQQNRLISGEHAVGGARVRLGKITCPVLTIVADKDTICPPEAATALNAHVGSAVKDVLTVAGGHVGAVVGSKAEKVLYPKLLDWLRRNACDSIN